jgi:hypothetical protein
MILHAIHADKAFGESGIKGRIIEAISRLITYPAVLVRVLETHELNKF